MYNVIKQTTQLFKALALSLVLSHAAFAITLDAYSYDEKDDYSNTLYDYCESEWQQRYKTFKAYPDIIKGFQTTYNPNQADKVTLKSTLNIAWEAVKDTPKLFFGDVTGTVESVTGVNYIYPTYLVIQNPEDLTQVTAECVGYYVAGRYKNMNFSLDQMQDAPMILPKIEDTAFSKNAAAPYAQDAFSLTLHNQSQQLIDVLVNSNSATASLHPQPYFPITPNHMQLQGFSLSVPQMDTLTGYNSAFQNNLITISWFNPLNPKQDANGAILSLFTGAPVSSTWAKIKGKFAAAGIVTLCSSLSVLGGQGGDTLRQMTQCGYDAMQDLENLSNEVKKSIRDAQSNFKSYDLTKRSTFSSDLSFVNKPQQRPLFIADIPVADPNLSTNATANERWLKIALILTAAIDFDNAPIMVLFILAGQGLDVASTYINYLAQGVRQIGLYPYPFNNKGSTAFLDKPSDAKDALCIGSDQLVLSNNGVKNYLGSSTLDLYIDTTNCGGQYDYTKPATTITPSFNLTSQNLLDYMISQKIVIAITPTDIAQAKVTAIVNSTQNTKTLEINSLTAKDIYSQYFSRGIPLFARYYNNQLYIYAAKEAVNNSLLDPVNAIVNTTLQTTSSDPGITPQNNDLFVLPFNDASQTYQNILLTQIYYPNLSTLPLSQSLTNKISTFFYNSQVDNQLQQLVTNITNNTINSNPVSAADITTLKDEKVAEEVGQLGGIVGLSLRVVKKYRLLKSFEDETKWQSSLLDEVNTTTNNSYKLDALKLLSSTNESNFQDASTAYINNYLLFLQENNAILSDAKRQNASTKQVAAALNDQLSQLEKSSKLGDINNPSIRKNISQLQKQQKQLMQAKLRLIDEYKSLDNLKVYQEVNNRLTNTIAELSQENIAQSAPLKIDGYRAKLQQILNDAQMPNNLANDQETLARLVNNWQANSAQLLGELTTYQANVNQSASDNATSQDLASVNDQIINDLNLQNKAYAINPQENITDSSMFVINNMNYDKILKELNTLEKKPIAGAYETFLINKYIQAQNTAGAELEVLALRKQQLLQQSTKMNVKEAKAWATIINNEYDNALRKIQQQLYKFDSSLSMNFPPRDFSIATLDEMLLSKTFIESLDNSYSIMTATKMPKNYAFLDQLFRALAEHTKYMQLTLDNAPKRVVYAPKTVDFAKVQYDYINFKAQMLQQKITAAEKQYDLLKGNTEEIINKPLITEAEEILLRQINKAKFNLDILQQQNFSEKQIPPELSRLESMAYNNEKFTQLPDRKNTIMLTALSESDFYEKADISAQAVNKLKDDSILSSRKNSLQSLSDADELFQSFTSIEEIITDIK
ncbi:hypothetical protein [Cysteiniphilum litorale]|uniref:hypothetical protein n=1 Tax=Cysteiniphilum litorale TaxID=2056700 RepID=UPI003F882CC3